MKQSSENEAGIILIALLLVMISAFSWGLGILYGEHPEEKHPSDSPWDFRK